MNSWKLFGTAASAVLAFACSATAQDCASPFPASVGDNAIATTAGVTISLAGFCDPGPFGDDSIYNTTWYAFVAPAAGDYVIQTCGTVNYDSRLAVLTDCNTMSSVLACNDDGAGGGCMTTTGTPFASLLCFTAAEGVTYYIAVGGYSAGDVGSGTMNISAGDCSGGGGNPNCGTGDNDCCVASASGTPYCTDADCCNAVCTIDPFCCNTSWDSICAGEAGDLCVNCGGGGGDPNCGTGSNDCCFESIDATPYCTDAECCNTVCGVDPFCCETAWDATCAAEAATMCVVCGGGGATCGSSAQDCCIANPAPACSDAACCKLVCGLDPFCCDTQWDGICAQEAAANCESCAVSCGKSAQDCCVAGSSPFCSDPDCCAAVCTIDPFCCQVQWDGICASEAFSLCPACAAGACGSSANDCCAAGAGIGCSDPDCCAAVCAIDGFCCQVQWDAICASEAQGICAVCAVPCDGPAATVNEAELCGEDLNGGCNAGGVNQPIAIGDIIQGTFWSSTALRDTDWYGFTLTEGTQVTANLYTSGPGFVAITDVNCAALVIFAQDTDGCPRTATFCLPAGDYYVVALMSIFADIGCETDGANYILETSGVPCDAEPPANDECEGAIEIFDGSTNFDTNFATTSGLPLDPLCEEGFGLSFEKDIWYFYEATCDGPVTVTTCGTAAYDTRLAAYLDCAGTLVGCNDDGPGCPNLTSQMTFEATSGTIYYIRVGGYSGGGAGTVTISCGGTTGPANDNCDGATVMVDGANAFSNIGASTGDPASSPAECGAFATDFFNDVWYTYTTTTSGEATFSTCNSAGFDTRLELWVGCPDEGGILVACNDDGSGCAGFTSIMTATLECDTKYLVRVGAYGAGGFGAGTLTITPAPDACEPPCFADFNDDGLVDGADLGVLLGEWGLAGGFGPADFNSDGIVDGADLGVLLGEWGPCD